ncbi:MAG: TonB-dependent receptor [Bacteroidales bacterium]|nr:TonB-dependent receptor [Bacteroidales bacterium]
MTKKPVYPMPGHTKILILLFISLFNCNGLLSQPMEFSFNRPGSSCYFNYLCYAQNGVYDSNKRPFIFVLGKSGETAGEAFEHDTLKDKPEFFHYMFVFIPNKGSDAITKLQCFEALASLLTFNFEWGHMNLFLSVYDPEIRTEDININNLNTVFKTAQLYNHVKDKDSMASTVNVGEVFSETYIDYEQNTGLENEPGTYYIEEEETTNEATITDKPKKIYFGKPSAFNFTLSGTIRDKSTGEALPFSTIQVRGTSNGTAANADGHFTLLKIPSDTAVLIIQYIGYDRIEVFMTPQTPKKNLVIEVSPSVFNLKAVNIVGKKEDVVLVNRAEVSTIKMTPRKMEQLPGLGEKDIMRSFQLMPGISASNESSSGLYVRGGTPDQNLVLYDGFTVYHVDHLYGFFSAFNSNALKDVQLYKGGFESRFGGRLSSVTEITGKDGNQKKYNIGGDLSLLSMNMFAEVPIGKKFTSVIAYRRSYKGALYNTIFKKFNLTSSGDQQPRTGPGGRQTQDTEVTNYFYDLNGKISYRANEKDVLALSFFNGTDKLDNSAAMNGGGGGPFGGGFSMNSTDLTKYGNIGSSLKWSRKWSEKVYGNTILSYSNYYSDRDRSQERSVVNDDDETVTTRMGVFENNDLKDYSLKSDFQWDITGFSQIQGGIFGSWYDINYAYAQNDTSSVLKKQNEALLTGVFLQSRNKLLKDKILLMPGFRTSYFETTGKVYVEPRFSVSLNLTDRISLKGSTGKFYQFVNRVTREDILSGSKDFWLLSDGIAVPVSSAIHYIAGLSYESNSYLFSSELYYKMINNLTEYSLRFNPSPMGVSYDENFFSGEGFSKGIEFLAQKKTGNFNGWVSYTLGEANNNFAVYSDAWYPANQDVNQEFKTVGLYKFKRWDFSATWIYATGRPYTAPSGAYSITLLDGTEQDFFTVTSKNGLRLPDYHRLDLSANYKILKGARGDKKRQEIGYIGLALFNVYNRKNVWYKTFTIEDGVILETNVNYLGITPNLTLSLKLR